MFYFMVALALLTVGCGSTRALNQTVPGALIVVNDSITARGPILAETDATITIAAHGVSQTYTKATVRDIQRTPVPDAAAIQDEAARNSARAASNSGILLVLPAIALLIGIVLILNK